MARDKNRRATLFPQPPTLIAQSQKHNIPVFTLTDAQIEQVGIILNTMKESRDDFKKSFDTLANSVELIAGI